MAIRLQFEREYVVTASYCAFWELFLDNTKVRLVFICADYRRGVHPCLKSRILRLLYLVLFLFPQN